MRAVKKKYSVYDFIGESQGAGLFIDRNSQQQGEQIYALVYRFLCSLPDDRSQVDLKKIKSRLKRKLVKLTADYHADCEHDRRLNRSKVKEDVQAFRNSAASMLCALRRLEPDARGTINYQAIPHLKRRGLPENNAVQRIFNMISVVHPATRAIVREKNYRTGQRALKNACKKAWMVWEEMIDPEFSRNYLIIPITNDKSQTSSLDDFVKFEHQFVHLILYGLNTKITSAQVRSALVSVAQERPKK